MCLPSFMSSNPETFNTLMLNFSDGGTPKSYRHSCIYSVNAYKFVTPSVSSPTIPFIPNDP